MKTRRWLQQGLVMHINQSLVKTLAGMLVVLMLVAWAEADTPATQPNIHVPHGELKNLAWQLAVPSGTFADKTVFDVIDLLHAHDIHHLELTPGQQLSTAMTGIKVGEKFSDEATSALLAKLKSVHMDIVSYGPVEFGSDEQINRAIFAFAKKIKAKNVIASVATGGLEPLDKLAAQFAINLAVEDGNYKTPEDLLAALVNRSARVGGDGDLISWPDQLAAVRRLHGHLIGVRIEQAKPEVLAELAGQSFKGVVVIVVKPGSGPSQVDRLVESVNRFSDALVGIKN